MVMMLVIHGQAQQRAARQQQYSDGFHRSLVLSVVAFLFVDWSFDVGFNPMLTRGNVSSVAASSSRLLRENDKDKLRGCLIAYQIKLRRPIATTSTSCRGPYGIYGTLVQYVCINTYTLQVWIY